MSTATKVVKSIYSKLVKEQQTHSDERSNDWRQLVQETAESKDFPTNEVIHFLASELGMNKESSVELFRQDVHTVAQYNFKMASLRKYEKEFEEWHNDLSVEEAKAQIKAMEKDLMELKSKLHREQRIQEILGSSRTDITQLIRSNRRLFDRPENSTGWLDLTKFPAKYKA